MSAAHSEDQEGLQDELDGLTKTLLFGHVAYVRRQDAPYDDQGRTVLWIAMRIGNIPVGIEFRRRGAWGVFDVIEETTLDAL